MSEWGKAFGDAILATAACIGVGIAALVLLLIAVGTWFTSHVGISWH